MSVQSLKFSSSLSDFFCVLKSYYFSHALEMKFQKLCFFVLLIFLGLTDSFTIFEYFRLLRFLAIQEREAGGGAHQIHGSSRRLWRIQPTKWPRSRTVSLSSVKPQFWQLRKPSLSISQRSHRFLGTSV